MRPFHSLWKRRDWSWSPIILPIRVQQTIESTPSTNLFIQSLRDTSILLRFNRHPQIEKLSWLDYRRKLESSNAIEEENEDGDFHVLSINQY
jgi:hypothetical protein